MWAYVASNEDVVSQRSACLRVHYYGQLNEFMPTRRQQKTEGLFWTPYVPGPDKIFSCLQTSEKPSRCAQKIRQNTLFDPVALAPSSSSISSPFSSTTLEVFLSKTNMRPTAIKDCHRYFLKSRDVGSQQQS